MLSHPHIMARSIPSLCVPQPLPKINLVFYKQPEVVGFYDVYDIGKFFYIYIKASVLNKCVNYCCH